MASERNRRRHHVFLFRHCVRSTDSTLDLYHPGGTEQNVSDFTASPLPEWNTPPMWCTHRATRTTENTGQFLMNLMIQNDTQVNSVRVQFVSDTSQRDVDTAFALSQGMARAAPAEVRIDGLSDLIYDPVLFSPQDGSEYYPPEKNKGPLCQQQYTQDQVRADIEARLKKIPPPDPGLLSTLSHLDVLGGVGVAGPLASIRPLNFTIVNDDKNKSRLEGGVNAVHQFAQMLFYSRAGGVDPPFLPNATIEEVYQILSWVHWHRSVLEVRNPAAATDGSVLARAVLDVLEHGQYMPDSDSNVEDYDVTATIFVGHDSNLDALGTALGVKWKLDPPYAKAEDYSPTPPGSAIHASFTPDDGRVELSFLYPVFLRGRGRSWKVHDDGKLLSFPLIFDPPLDPGTNERDDTATGIWPLSDELSGLDILRSRVLSELQKYPGAIECYHKLPVKSPTLPSSSSSVYWNLTATLAIGTAAVIAVFVVLMCRRMRRNVQAATSQEDYDVVSRDIEVL